MGYLNDTEADVRAINAYFNRTAPLTAAAAQLKKEWENWYSGLNFISIKLDSTFQQATNRRNAFNIAQARNPAELQQKKEFLANADGRALNEGKPMVRPDLYAQTDSAGNFPKQKGITVASAAPGSIPKGARPTIRKGSVGPAVGEWQKIVGVKADNNFGSGTHTATVTYQKARGLVADGVVGSATWATALGGANAPSIPFEQAAVTPVSPEGVPASVAATGSVAQIGSIKQPEPTVPAPKPRVSTKAATKAAEPAVQTTTAPVVATAAMTGNPVEIWKQLPTWAKASTVVSAVALVGVNVWGAMKAKR